MKIFKSGILILGLSLASGLASAASVTGSLGLSGFVTVTSNEYMFGIDSNNTGTQTAVVASGTGSFMGLGFPTTAVTNNLFSGTGAGQVNPGGSFAPVNFIDVTTAGGPVQINLTSLPITATPVCNGISDTVACRPNGGSAIVLEPFGTGTQAVLQGIGSAFYTVTPGTTSQVAILLSANFAGQSIDQILAGFAATGKVATNYSDNLVVTAVPEPSALAALGLGLVGLGAWKKRKAA